MHTFDDGALGTTELHYQPEGDISKAVGLLFYDEGELHMVESVTFSVTHGYVYTIHKVDLVFGEDYVIRNHPKDVASYYREAGHVLSDMDLGSNLK